MYAGLCFCAGGVKINLLQMTKITFLLDESFHFSALLKILLHRESYDAFRERR